MSPLSCLCLEDYLSCELGTLSHLPSGYLPRGEGPLLHMKSEYELEQTLLLTLQRRRVRPKWAE
jgi:hypothetical protein